ncbi:FeoA family protein [uncultured Clostridium sp.]|uniref:FeoA family protein n=1 Tax=uncultured Clostridium sp. TaxID=59620 RepID=UPI0026226320|nr:FeoA family protein [uncultured Clostridium sp.]
MNTLDMLTLGDRVRVRGLEKGSNVKRRLLDMGVTPGIEIEIIGMAPMGDPINIELRGYKLTIRRNEAKAILI